MLVKRAFFRVLDVDISDCMSSVSSSPVSPELPVIQLVLGRGSQVSFLPEVVA